MHGWYPDKWKNDVGDDVSEYHNRSDSRQHAGCVEGRTCNVDFEPGKWGGPDPTELDAIPGRPQKTLIPSLIP